MIVVSAILYVNTRNINHPMRSLNLPHEMEIGRIYQKEKDFYFLHDSRKTFLHVIKVAMLWHHGMLDYHWYAVDHNCLSIALNKNATLKIVLRQLLTLMPYLTFKMHGQFVEVVLCQKPWF